METQKKQGIDTGSGHTQSNQILAGSVSASTAEQSKPSQKSTSIAAGSTKPLSIPEALSLIQTLLRDLRGMGVKVAIIPMSARLFIGIDTGSLGEIGFLDGHITFNKVPVLEAEK